MSTVGYYMDDAALTLPAGYRDRTTHILEWALEGGDKIALVVQREKLEKLADTEDAEVAFDRYAVGQVKTYPSQFPSYHQEGVDKGELNAAFAVRRVRFRWRYEQEIVYHAQVFVLLGADVLALTASAKAIHREAVDRLAHEALANLRARGGEEYR